MPRFDTQLEQLFHMFWDYSKEDIELILRMICCTLVYYTYIDSTS